MAQFLTMDWGMEFCTVNISLPLTSDAHTQLAALSTDTVVSVWMLNTTEELDLASLSYSNRPPRQVLLGSWSLDLGTNMSSYALIRPT